MKLALMYIIYIADMKDQLPRPGWVYSGQCHSTTPNLVLATR
jgi:hypothetical protein